MRYDRSTILLEKTAVIGLGCHSFNCNVSFMKNQSGFTFVEVIISVVIFSILMVFGSSFFVFGNNNMAGVKNREFALLFAKETIEGYKEQVYTTNNTGLYSWPELPDQTKTFQGALFTCRSTITTVSGTTNNLRYLTVAVDWTGSTIDTVTVATYVVHPTQYPYPS